MLANGSLNMRESTAEDDLTTIIGHVYDFGEWLHKHERVDTFESILKLRPVDGSEKEVDMTLPARRSDGYHEGLLGSLFIKQP
jgi:hypothetical protein